LKPKGKVTVPLGASEKDEAKVVEATAMPDWTFTIFALTNVMGDSDWLVRLTPTRVEVFLLRS